MHRPRVLVAIALLAGALPVAAVIASATPAVAAGIVVTPSTDLHDGQVVQVQATGVLAGEVVTLSSCKDALCRPLGTFNADGSGNLSVAAVAHAVIRPDAAFPPAPAPCNGTCDMVLTGTTSGAVSSALGFDSDAPLVDNSVRLTVGGVPVTPANPLFDGQTVGVRVAPGYFDLGQPLRVAQCVGGPFDGNQFQACTPFQAIQASATDGSVSTAVTVVLSLTPPSTGCNPDFCFVVVLGLPQDLALAGLQVNPAAPSSTTTSPSTSATAAAAATVAPRFTG